MGFGSSQWGLRDAPGGWDQSEEGQAIGEGVQVMGGRLVGELDERWSNSPGWRKVEVVSGGD